jgi:multidrug efflux system membrane fusion protein
MIDGLRVVRTGLKPGEKVVVDGLQRVRPGSPITPQIVPMSASNVPAKDAAKDGGKDAKLAAADTK